MTMLFGGTALAAGWTYTTSGKQVYQQDDGSIAKNTWIKAEDNGNTIWYYATNDGSLKPMAGRPSAATNITSIQKA